MMKANETDILMQVVEDILHIDKIFSSDIFDIKQQENPLVDSAFICLLIHLRDILEKAKDYSRISFDDDVKKSEEHQINDITDLVAYMRNAACHMNSPKRVYKGIRISSNIFYGAHAVLEFYDFKFESKYENDVCMVYGSFHIYLYHHILRAFIESLILFIPLIKLKIDNLDLTFWLRNKYNLRDLLVEPNRHPYEIIQ